MPRSSIHLSINGRPFRVTGNAAFLSLSDFLRLRLRMTGTKIVCSEGDCGACTVLVARPLRSARFQPMDACITWMFQLDHAHVLTVEGLQQDESLHPVQEAMIAGHGSQCGFCTPGFVVAMAGLTDDARADGAAALTDDNVRRGLTGNLCRCTGYSQIIDAGLTIRAHQVAALSERHPIGPVVDEWKREEKTVHVIHEGREAFIPATLDEAGAYLAKNPAAKIISGATDVGVHLNKELYPLAKALYIGGLSELQRIERRSDRLMIGAGATWEQIAAEVESDLPQLCDIISRFGAPQIRSAATIGGNVINASPIADALPLLYVTDARLLLISTRGERWVKVADFYLGYKKLDLKPGELLATIEFTLPTPAQHLRLYKVSKRRDLDISTFTAAILLTMAGERIADARIAYGGVGPVVLRLPRTEAFLKGREPTEPTMLEAGAIARTEITPITDVRASAEYRGELAETILMKAYFDIVSSPVAS